MVLNPIAQATARRNVADRFDRFLKGLQQARRQPNRRELFWLRQALASLENAEYALASLENAEYPAGEDALDKAERALPVPIHATNDPSTNADVTVEQLRAQLDQILEAQA